MEVRHGRFVSVALLACLIWVGCSSTEGTPERAASLGIDTTAFDRSVRPQDDLYDHVNGSWIRRTEMPGDRAMWGEYFQVRRQARQAVRSLIRTADSTDAEQGTPRQKVADLYASYVDTARRDGLGAEPLRDELQRIADVEGRSGLVELLAWFQRLPAESPLTVSVGPDNRNPTENEASIRQDGLGLPSRAHYLDRNRAEERRAYREHVAEIFRLAGLSEPSEAARQVLDLETRLAEAHWPPERARDARASYNPLTWSELTERAPGVDWTQFAEAAGLDGVDTVVVGQPSYVDSLASLLTSRPLEQWRRYFQWQLLDGTSSFLSSDFVRARFEFYQSNLQGVQQQAPLWRRAVRTVNSSLGPLVGKLYVDEHFSREKKRRAERLVEDLRAAFHREIDGLAWMSDSTKAAAHRKLRAMTAHVAYPDEWRDYSGLRIERGDLVGNMKRVARFDYESQVDRLDERVDKAMWRRAVPQEVNGYIDNDRNLITVTAGILQPPFFQEDVSPAVNYGAIGVVIGHEISHAFDSEGRKYDHRGRLRDWWTERDARRFEERARALVEQFDRFNPVDTLHVDGELTLPENIADLAGVAAAHRAYQIRTEGEVPPTIGGFTGDQRFFLSYAQMWRMKIRDQAMRQLLERDPHAPVRYRINGIVPHVDAFYDAFDVARGDSLYRAPERQVRIW